MFKKDDCVVGITAILVGIGIIVQAQHLKVKTSLDPAGPKALPVILASGMIIIGLIHIVGGWYAARHQAGGPPPRSFAEKYQDYKPVLAIIAISLGYAGLMNVLGYLVLTPLLIGSIMWVLNIRDIKRLSRISLSMTAILFVVFRWGLQVKLPLGLFENLF
jgi:hypothetical protein